MSTPEQPTRRGVRPGFIAAVIVVAGLIIGGAFFAVNALFPVDGGSTDSDGQTRVVTFEPFSPDGLNRDLLVEGSGPGICFAGSIASPRPDAWRCNVGNVIHDPCFSSPYDVPVRQVACPDLSRHSLTAVTLVNLRGRLPVDTANPVLDNPGAPQPFFFVLVNGARCSWATGATTLVGNERLNGGCSDGTSWVGDITRPRGVWAVEIVKPGTSELVPTTIQTAWV